MKHAWTLAIIVLPGCGEEKPSLVGASEPVRVVDGVFQEGDLPENPDATTPLVTNAASVGSVVTQGQGNIPYAGLTTPDTFAVAVAFPGLGTGYWTKAVGGPDVTAENQLEFQLTTAFTEAAPYGLQTLSFVAIDGEGRPGPRYDAPLCILPENANNSLAACDPTVSPQSRVLSLTWDTNADLDLVIVAPNGKIVSAKAPTTVIPPEQGAIPFDQVTDPSTGRLSRDSNGNCRIDGIRRESLVFQGPPAEGTYEVYVSLAALCGAPQVTWRLELFRRLEGDGETQPVERVDLGAGQLLPIHADGGRTLGTHAGDVALP